MHRRWKSGVVVVRREAFITRRQYMGFTQASLAAHLNAGVPTVGCWERGQRNVSTRFRQPLAAALQVSIAELDRLLDPQAPQRLVGLRVPGWLTTYESLVHEAGELREVEFVAIPGLLQTASYIRAAERTSGIDLTTEQIEAVVELRQARQKALLRDHEPLDLTVLLSEAVLRDIIGSAAVMVEQLDHLIEISDLPNVDIRVLGDGLAPAAINGFELVTRRYDHVPYLACTLDVGGARYHEDPDVVKKFVARFDHLARSACPPSDTLRRIQDIREDLDQ
jgi:transcriptional regulator with XRE-family HTH domain